MKRGNNIKRGESPERKGRGGDRGRGKRADGSSSDEEWHVISIQEDPLRSWLHGSCTGPLRSPPWMPPLHEILKSGRTYLIGYAYYYHRSPRPPPHSYIDSVHGNDLLGTRPAPNNPDGSSSQAWEEFRDYLQRVKYRSPLWKIEHDKFMSASTAGGAVGVSPYKTINGTLHDIKHPPQRDQRGRYVTCRGVSFETVHADAYMYLNRNEGVILKMQGTTLHPAFRFLVATPDALVYSLLTDTLLRICEYKTPMGDVYTVIPPHYMAQVQLTMSVFNVTECDFMSFYYSDANAMCIFVVIRVYRNDEYLARLITSLEAFCAAALTGLNPQAAAFFIPLPIRAEILARVNDVIDLIPGGRAKAIAAKAEADSKSKEKEKE